MFIEFSVGLGRNERIDEIAGHAKVAEQSGFSHLAFVDQPNVSRDMYVMMAIAAMNTSRIQIGQGVTDPITYHPSVTANATATINELSGGRVFLGIGTGGPFGKEMKPRPLSELREVIEFIRTYVDGQEAEVKSTRMHSKWIRRPFPIYMACNGPRSCQLAGEVADGAIIGGAMLPEVVKWKVGLIREEALKAGRDPSKIDIWAFTLIFVAESKEAAQREVAGFAITKARGMYHVLLQDNPNSRYLYQMLERHHEGIVDELKTIYEAYDPYTFEMMDAPENRLASQRIIDLSLLTGPPGDICEQIARLGEVGVNNISTVLYTLVDKKGMMRTIGDEIMPHFRN